MDAVVDDWVWMTPASLPDPNGDEMNAPVRSQFQLQGAMKPAARTRGLGTPGLDSSQSEELPTPRRDLLGVRDSANLVEDFASDCDSAMTGRRCHPFCD